VRVKTTHGTGELVGHVVAGFADEVTRRLDA
jgi:hypothetical protein